ncbi:MAG: hypothetical protein JWM06_1669 [Actinomycetia bacterium]|nr:hypothetical protein [Actinomycetes bacterium]
MTSPLTPEARRALAATYREIGRRRHPGCIVTVTWESEAPERLRQVDRKPVVPVASSSDNDEGDNDG